MSEALEIDQLGDEVAAKDQGIYDLQEATYSGYVASAGRGQTAGASWMLDRLHRVLRGMKLGKAIPLVALLAFALASCEEPTPIAPGPAPPDRVDTRPRFTHIVDRVEMLIAPEPNLPGLPQGVHLPRAEGGEGDLVYSATGLPGDLEIAEGPQVLGNPRTAGEGEYPVVLTVHDSDDNRTEADSDTMRFVLVIRPLPVEPQVGVLRSCQYSRASDDAGFNISVEFAGEFDPWLQDEVNCAAAYWETAITADIGLAVQPEGFVAGCFAYGSSYQGREVDDLLIVVHFASLNGAAATAWTCEERPGVGLPATARIAFAANSERYDLPRIAANPSVYVLPGVLDEDLNFLYNLARHEIGHALGFGSSSAFTALVSPFQGPVPGGLFRGENAVREWGEPVALTGGHWANIPTDIMSARIFSSQTATRVTLGAMDDIGYVVDYGMAGR